MVDKQHIVVSDYGNTMTGKKHILVQMSPSIKFLCTLPRNKIAFSMGFRYAICDSREAVKKHQHKKVERRGRGFYAAPGGEEWHPQLPSWIYLG